METLEPNDKGEPKPNLELTLEQQFKLKLIRDQVGNLTSEQKDKMIVDLATQNMMKDQLFKKLVVGSPNLGI